MIFPKFHGDSCALVTQYLTPALYKRLAPLKTKTGFTLDAAIQSGLRNPDSHIGIYAGDAHSYYLFSEILDPIIHAYHEVNESFSHAPGLEQTHLPPLDPEGCFILSSRVRVARNIEGFSFPCHITPENRNLVQSLVSQATKKIPRDLAGNYLAFQDIPPGKRKSLSAKKQIFPMGDRFQEAAGINRDFPNARGIFTSHDKKFRIWVNEEDHLRIISMESSSDISGVFNRLCQGVDYLSNCLEFARDKKHGFLTSCPTNIGTAMRAGVHIRLEKLEKNQDLLTHLIHRYHLQIRGTCGEKTAVEKAIFDISNTQRLGISGNQIIQDLHTGVAAIIAAEKKL